MRERLVKGHHKIYLNNLSTGLVEVTMGELMGSIIADHRLPLALCHDFKLYCKSCNPPSVDSVVSMHSRFAIQLAFILDVSRRSCLLLRK